MSILNVLASRRFLDEGHVSTGLKIQAAFDAFEPLKAADYTRVRVDCAQAGGSGRALDAGNYLRRIRELVGERCWKLLVLTLRDGRNIDQAGLELGLRGEREFNAASHMLRWALSDIKEKKCIDLKK
jgi:hypothetical protein